MENLKDMQIKAQAETIKDMDRKIESLEKELQKHLDPDSGDEAEFYSREIRKDFLFGIGTDNVCRFLKAAIEAAEEEINEKGYVRFKSEALCEAKILYGRILHWEAGEYKPEGPASKKGETDTEATYDKERYEKIVLDASDTLIINERTNSYISFLQMMFREYVSSKTFERMKGIDKASDTDHYTELLVMLNKFEQAEALILEGRQEDED